MRGSRLAAASLGALYVVAGVVGFLPALGGSFGIDSANLLGLFPVNLVLNLAHLALGAGGMAVAFQRTAVARLYDQGAGLILAVVALVGVTIASSGNFLGLVPIGGFDVALHTGTAAVLLFVGFAGPTPDRSDAD